MYEMVMDKGKYLLLHVGNGPVGNEYVGLDHFKKLMKRYPELPAIVAHMGAYEYKGFMDMLDDNPNMYLDTAFAFFKEFDGKGSYDLGKEALECYRKRILYGSDFPNLILPRESEIETLLNYGLSDEFYEGVFFENGKELIERTVSGL
jgi:predicted TIM-barrel fold metal-dependent hydrolase